MQDYMTDIEDIYEKMSNGLSLQDCALPGKDLYFYIHF